MNTPFIVLVASAAISLAASVVRAQDAPPEIKLQNGRFEPSQLAVPARAAFKLHVTNADTSAVEFESFELHRERVVQPGETITVFIPALEPGSYPFFDDFHRDTPPGAIIAK
ncbi:MAG: cupredoxin domain-containing protein [Deltaproteobacteria bacterium]|nr:cupredoxin domain-containing protein [Deltaproteobacteria bacterium]MBI3387688.1 cupredoxin domain-containing protein [Deltaproteobacteria bacterium]